MYCSRLPESGAWRTNFFSIGKADISGHTVWCNPLWKDIPSVCQWLRRGPHNIRFNMLLLTPLWPDAAWNVDLQRMSVDSRVIKRAHGLFVRRDGVAMPPPSYDLKVWLISGHSVVQHCGFSKQNRGQQSTVERSCANQEQKGSYLSDSMRSPAPQPTGSNRSVDLTERRQRRRQNIRRAGKEMGILADPMNSNIKRGESSEFRSGYIPRKYRLHATPKLQCFT